MRLAFRIIVLALALVAVSASAQAQQDEVFLYNGEFYQGKIIAIGHSQVLIQTEERIFSIERADIRYVFRTKERWEVRRSQTTQQSARTQEPSFDTLDRAYMLELGGGLYTFSGFALSMHAIHWIRLKKDWSLGVIGALDFSRYVMLRFGVQAKKTFMPAARQRPYFVGGASIGPLAGNFVSNISFGGQSDFSPVVQTHLGGGIWYDTGYKLAFTIEGGMALTYFTVERTFNNGFNQIRRSTEVNLNGGPYFRVGIVF